MSVSGTGKAFKPNDAAAINSITTCLLAINKWMSNNFLKLNDDKTDMLLVGPKTKREMLFYNLGKLTPWMKSEITNLKMWHTCFGEKYVFNVNSFFFFQ